MDATKVPTVLEALLGYQAIVGGVFPNHFIGIRGKKKDEVKAILDGKDKKYGKIEEATEVKITVVTFQNTPPGVSPTEIIASRPQSNKDANTFIKYMEASASAAANEGRARFSNLTVDGVSCESKHV